MATLTWINVLLVVSTGAFFAAGYSANRVPVAASVAVGVLARVGFALMTSDGHTMLDTRNTSG